MVHLTFKEFNLKRTTQWLHLIIIIFIILIDNSFPPTRNIVFLLQVFITLICLIESINLVIFIDGVNFDDRLAYLFVELFELHFFVTDFHAYQGTSVHYSIYIQSIRSINSSIKIILIQLKSNFLPKLGIFSALLFMKSFHSSESVSCIKSVT